MRRAAGVIGALLVACGWLGCGAEEAALPAVTPAQVRPLPLVAAPLVAGEGSDASVTRWNVDDASAPYPAPAPRPRPPVPEPMFGATESVKPGDAHAFRLAAALRAMRASRSGAKVLKMLSVIPAVIDAKTRTGVDPFADGEWLLVYGSKVDVPGPNANVIKHARSESELSRTIADGGFEAWDAGGASSAGTGNAVRGELDGVKDVLLRPQPGLVALVPGDRARDLAAVLAKPIELGVPAGALAKIFVAEPAKLTRLLPAEVVRATTIVKAAADAGLDLSAEAECPDAATCTATAASLDELARRSNSLMVRIVTKNVLSGLAVRADGTKLHATLHAAPDQVDAALFLLRGTLGLPAEDPSDQTHR